MPSNINKTYIIAHIKVVVMRAANERVAALVEAAIWSIWADTYEVTPMGKDIARSAICTRLFVAMAIFSADGTLK